MTASVPQRANERDASANDGSVELSAEGMLNIPSRPYLWMLLAALAFAGMAAFAHALGPLVDWRLVALVRSALALVFALGLVWMRGAKIVIWRPGTLWLRSLAGSVSMVCTFYGLTRLPVAEVLTISNVFPVWVALFSWPLLGEVPGRGVWGAIVLGLLGVALVEQPHWLEGNFAAAVVLGGSLFTAIAMLGLHRLKGIDSRAIVAHFSGVAVLTSLALILFDVGGQGGNAIGHLKALPVIANSTFDAWSIFLLLGMGVSATIGQVFLTKAFAAGPPAKVSVVALTQVAFALGIDMAVWGHAFNSWSLLGVALVVAPTAWLLLSQARSVGAAAELE